MTDKKFCLVSDLHLDINNTNILKFGFIKNLENIDYLLIAGDTSGSYFQELDNLEMLRDYISNNNLKTRVITVGGNHSWYDFKEEFISKNTGITMLSNSFNEDPIYFLENNIFEDEDIIIFGATLYTDLKLFGDINLALCYHKYMNDFRYVYKEAKNQNLPVTPFDYMKWHADTMEKLKEICEKYKDKDIVVVTHHAPYNQSISPEYVNDFLNPFYASDLSEFILKNQNIKTWCHGHIHSNSDYSIGNTKILCNPYGYANYEGKVKPQKYIGKDFVLT